MAAKTTAGFAPKDRVDHFAYGPGTVVSVSERHTNIVFDGAGAKKFMTSMVQLTRSDIPAPKTRRSKKKTAGRQR